MNRKKIIFFIAAGIILIACAIGYAVCSDIEAAEAQEAALEAEDVLEGLYEAAGTQPFVNEPDQASSADEEYDAETGIPAMSVLEIDGQEYIGTVEVPSVGIKMPIISECDEEKLRISPCRYSGSYYTDDLVLSGHNYRGGRHFSPLRNVEVGADVRYTTVEGKVIKYKVSAIEDLKPTEVDRMITKDGWDLTLYTCRTLRDVRLTVRCVRTE